MPELPEVETIRRDLSELVQGKKIAQVKVTAPKIVRGSVANFQKGLSGQTIQSIDRRGKLLILTLQQGKAAVLLHLKMTGQLIYQDQAGLIAGGHSFPDLDQELPNKHTHVVFQFSDGEALFFNDVRKFGYLQLVGSIERQEAEARYGPEPLDKEFSEEYLWQITRRRQTALKNILLNQKLIAGLGNIYVDEACFRAGIKPSRSAYRLTRAEVKRLHREIKKVITLALKHRGTTFNNYRDAKGRTGNFVKHLKVYGRAGQKCFKPTCRQAGSIIKKITVGGRGTHFCPNCQL